MGSITHHSKNNSLQPEHIGPFLGSLLALLDAEELDISNVIRVNQLKTKDRFSKSESQGTFKHPDNAKEWECFPEKLEVEFQKVTDCKAAIVIDGWRYGDLLTDNSTEKDGYRFHDIFHFSFMAVLGWSPVTRSLLKMKRKSDAKIDEIEDGARAMLIEEGIAHLAFRHGQKYDFRLTKVDQQILMVIKLMVEGYEAEDIRLADWEDAIVQAYRVFRKVKRVGQGKILIDRKKREIKTK